MKKPGWELISLIITIILAIIGFTYTLGGKTSRVDDIVKEQPLLHDKVEAHTIELIKVEDKIDALDKKVDKLDKKLDDKDQDNQINLAKMKDDIIAAYKRGK